MIVCIYNSAWDWGGKAVVIVGGKQFANEIMIFLTNSQILPIYGTVSEK